MPACITRANVNRENRAVAGRTYKHTFFRGKTPPVPTAYAHICRMARFWTQPYGRVRAHPTKSATSVTPKKSNQQERTNANRPASKRCSGPKQSEGPQENALAEIGQPKSQQSVESTIRYGCEIPIAPMSATLEPSYKQRATSAC